MHKNVFIIRIYVSEVAPKTVNNSEIFHNSVNRSPLFFVFCFFFYFSIASNKMDLANRWDQLNSIQLSTTQSAISATYTHIRISWRIDGFLDAFYIPVKLCTCQDFLLLAGYSAWCANTFTVGGRRWIQLEDDTNCERNGMKHTHTETIKLIIPSVH